jgi:hypothetical protein
MAGRTPLALVPLRGGAVCGAWVLVVVVESADTKRALSIVLLNTVTAGVVADSGVCTLNLARAGLLVGSSRTALLLLRLRLRHVARGLARLVPVVMGTHRRALALAGVLLDKVAGQGVAAGGGILASDSWPIGPL